MPEEDSPIVIERHESIIKDLKRLRRFHTIERSLQHFEALLSDDYPNIGIPMQGFGDRELFKGDLHIENAGKQGRGAARVIYEKRTHTCQIIYVYAKNEDLREDKIRQVVNERLCP